MIESVVTSRQGTRMNYLLRVAIVTALTFTSLGQRALSKDNVFVQIVSTKDEDGMPLFGLSVTNYSKLPIVLEPNGSTLYARLVSGKEEWQPITMSHCQALHLSPTSMQITTPDGKVVYTSPSVTPSAERVLGQTVLPAGKTTTFIAARVIPGICAGISSDPFAVYGKLAWKFVDGSEMQSSSSAIVHSDDAVEPKK